MKRDIAAVGASAGGVEALIQLVRGLPEHLPAAVLVVLHLPTDATSALPHILSRSGPLPASHACDAERIQHGHIYVAPPDHHMLVDDGTIHLTRGPKENGHRPAVDPLFRSAAQSYGDRVVGVVLSGTLDDGAAGLVAIKMNGGLSVVQSPDDAIFAGMPSAALTADHVDYAAAVSEIGPLLARLAQEPGEARREIAVSDGIRWESRVVQPEGRAPGLHTPPGAPSVYSCPECHGTLWEANEGALLHFRCRVGHAFSAESLLSQQRDYLDTALRIALRALEEQAAFARRLGRRAREAEHGLAARRFETQAREAEQSAGILRAILTRGENNSAIGVEPERPPAG